MNHEARQKRVICLGLVIETKIKIFGLPFTSFQLKKKNFTEDKEIKIKKKKKSKDVGVAPLSSSQLGTSGLCGIHGQNLLKDGGETHLNG